MVKVKQLHCTQRPTMSVYSDSMITWKLTSNVCSNLKEWSQLFYGEELQIFRNITINNDDSEIRPL